ncbi:MAG: peptidoglycan DD-metalloendopeptidase family protein [Porphyrobacter sp.]|nr:peptidoglycan DD-metalloendopeptidase family protein [Porphyrobacter sp.]
MRSQGQVRFIKVSAKLQMRLAAAVFAVVLVWLASLAVMAWGQYRAESDLAAFADKRARVAKSEERLEAYGSDLDRVVGDLKQRQDFLEEMAQMLPDDVVAEGAEGTVTDSSAEAAKTVEKVGQYIPQARGLAEVEARQLALVERLTRFADARARRAEAAMRKLNLDPKALTRKAQAGMGGPFEAFAGSDKGELDPRFERLGLSLARMAVLERALDGIPQVVPATAQSITSGFGYRRDPFNGRAAMHAGIDFRGPVGSPIFAAADGRVTWAGRRGGYGNAVEITHANGLMTRYAHLSRIDVKVGQLVKAGETVGGLGSTGRSTGPHLHFEVRINNRAINPRPFLETAPDVLKEVRRSRAGHSAVAGAAQ